MAVAGKEGEALFKNQQAAVLNAFQWAAADTSESENLAMSSVVAPPEEGDTVASATIIYLEPGR